MSDNPNKNDFAARLARIEAGKPQSAAPKSKRTAQQNPYDTPLIRTAPKTHHLRNGIIWALIFAAIGGAGWYGVRQMDGTLSDKIAGLSEGMGQFTASMTTPVSLTRGASGANGNRQSASQLAERGWRLSSPAVALPNHGQTDVTTVTAGFVPATPDTAPGSLIQFDPNTTCTLRRPTSDETVVNVRLESAALAAPVQAFSEVDLIEQVTENIRGLTEHNKPYLRDGRVDGQLGSVDVFVTDTSSPVYLVLQSLGSNIIWNVQPAEGVTIAHVAMIGNESGLAAIPGDPTFEALRISDFVEEHEYGNDDVVRDCMIRPWRAPEDHWTGVQKAQNDNQLYVNQIYTYTKGHAAFAAWYTDTLGVDPNSNLTAVDRAAHVVAGPVPATPVQYQSLSGRDVYLTRTPYVVVGTDDGRAAEIDAIQTALMTQAAGGDLALLTPPAMEVTTQ